MITEGEPQEGEEYRYEIKFNYTLILYSNCFNNSQLNANDIEAIIMIYCPQFEMST